MPFLCAERVFLVMNASFSVQTPQNVAFPNGLGTVFQRVFDWV
jgi:hypothetical protein